MKLLRAAGVWQLRLPRSLWITWVPKPRSEMALTIWLGHRRLLPRKVRGAEGSRDA